MSHHGPREGRFGLSWLSWPRGSAARWVEARDGGQEPNGDGEKVDAEGRLFD